MKRSNIKFGLEIECETDRDISVGSYHEPDDVGRYWGAEEDGSLTAENDDWNSVEFVSIPITRKQLKPALLELKNKIIMDRNNYFSHFEINNTCGNHIHFSVNNSQGRTKHFNGMFMVSDLQKMASKVRDRFLAKFGQDFIKHYDRYYYREGYADEHKLPYVIESGRDKYREFNCTSNKGAEWRSFHLRMCNTWDQLIECYDIALEEIENMFITAYRNRKLFYHKESFTPLQDRYWWSNYSANKISTSDIIRHYYRNRDIQIEDMRQPIRCSAEVRNDYGIWRLPNVQY